MAKQRLEIPMTAGDLNDYLSSNDDFSFEREIFSRVKNVGLESVAHAGLYEDPLQHKQRQFDIRAFHAQGLRKVELAIECKRLSPSFPLLVSCVPRSDDEAFHNYLVGYERVSGANTYVRVGIARHSQPAALYRAGLLVGKSMTQVGREVATKAITAGDSEVFDKWAQALSSIADAVSRAMRDVTVRRQSERYVAFLPVLVVPNGTLWGAKYSADGRLRGDPTQEPELKFYVGRQYPIPNAESGSQHNLVVSHLHICTVDGLDDLLRHIAYDDGFWKEMFPD